MSRGGKRMGAGRPKGSGKYSEPTKAIRIPESMVSQVMAYAEAEGYKIPLYGSKISAGYPSPSDDYIEGKIDLNEHLIHHPSSTFFVRVAGYSMLNTGMHPGDILVVDRSLEPRHGKIVIAALEDELTVKRLYKKAGEIRLMPENEDYEPIEISSEADLHIWGVVTNVIHPV